MKSIALLGVFVAALASCEYSVPGRDLALVDMTTAEDMTTPTVQNLPFSRVIQAGAPAAMESTATCPTGGLVVGGDCTCTVGTVAATAHTAGEAWKCRCSTGEATASAVCLLSK